MQHQESSGEVKPIIILLLSSQSRFFSLSKPQLLSSGTKVHWTDMIFRRYKKVQNVQPQFNPLLTVCLILSGSCFMVKHENCMCGLCLCVTGESMDTHKQIVDRLRSTFRSGVTIPEEFRRAQLNKLMALMKENEERILEALHKDLAKVLREAHTLVLRQRQCQEYQKPQTAKGRTAAIRD